MFVEVPANFINMVITKFGKYFICCVILNIAMISIVYHLICYDSETRFKDLKQINKSMDLKYLLVWTSMAADPIKYFGEGTSAFINRNCSYTNCYVSSNRHFFKDIVNFDVILFHGPELTRQYKVSNLPQTRSPQQKYVFASMESSAYYPICDNFYNSYFNWTWTYKLNSDEIYGYITIKNKEGRVIGPKEEMHWEKVEAMLPINDTLKAKLKTKKIAAAWFVSNCRAPSGRDLVAKQLQTELAKYGMQVDVYGKCGKLKCPRGSTDECLRKLETDYYFYLSFENSFAEDYVTEKLLHAFQHYAVPVVYGGANYTRFMPDGIYLTAEKSRVKELAKAMKDIISDKQKYYDFFKWHNHCSYHNILKASDTDKYCKFCALMNNKQQIVRTTIYEDFSQWWNPIQHKYHATKGT